MNLFEEKIALCNVEQSDTPFTEGALPWIIYGVLVVFVVFTVCSGGE